MLSLSQPVWRSTRAARSWSARRTGTRWRRRPTAPPGRWTASRCVLVEPASPLETLTTTPAATAASLNCLVDIQRRDVRERVRAERLVRARSRGPSHGVVDRLQEAGLGGRPRCSPKTSRPTRLAPGATPSIRTLHAAGSGWALKFCTLYTCAPCPAMVLASRNASSPLGRLARAVAAEVLEVDERRRARAGADEVDVVRVNAVGDPGDLDARARDAQRARRLGVRVVAVGAGR